MCWQAHYQGCWNRGTLQQSLASCHQCNMSVRRLDEQLIMACTGHSSSAGVRSYKRVTEHLKKKTSDILNLRAMDTGCEKPVGTKDKENTDPALPKWLTLPLLELLISLTYNQTVVVNLLCSCVNCEMRSDSCSGFVTQTKTTQCLTDLLS